MFGSIGCGWGSTYWNVGPGVESSTRFTQHNVASVYDCCLVAQSLESTTIDRRLQGVLDRPIFRRGLVSSGDGGGRDLSANNAGAGGAAVRFQLRGTQCHVDREIMLRSNLDASSGKAMKDQGMCSFGHLSATVTNGVIVAAGDGGDLFWRDASGGAEASNLRSPGLCAKQNKFKQLPVSAGVDVPEHGMYFGVSGGRFNELPNHRCDNNVGSGGWGGGGCKFSIMYNPVGDLGACCEACATLQWVADLGGNNVGDAESGTGVVGSGRGASLEGPILWKQSFKNFDSVPTM